MLANVSRIESSDTAQELHTALVSGRANNWFLLDNAPGCTRAKVAARCLLEPEIGDTVLVSVSACAVTTTDSVLLPTASASAVEALPLATVTPFTRMLAPLLVAVGVSVRLLTPLATLAV